MLRTIAMTSLVLLLQGAVLHAQESALDLRGGVDDDMSLEEQAETPSLAEQDLNPTNPLKNRPSVARLRSELNSAVAEEGSTGLGTAGREIAVRPFSDRLSAVERIGATEDDRPEDEVFDGDTVFDEPVGIRLGTFTILPEVTTMGGWTDNASGSSTGTSSSLYRISPSIEGSSDWSRHQLDFALRGSYVGYPGSDTEAVPSLSGSTRLQLDLSDVTTVNAAASYSYTREDASSIENPSGDTHVHQLGGSVGLTRDAGLVSVSLTTGIERNFYTNDGSSGSVKGRNNTLYSAGLRLDSNGGSTLSPFAETALLLRRFDDTCSGAACENRNANGYELRGGVRIDSGPKVTGEIGAGWRIEELEDSRLGSLEGFVVDGSLVWSPSRLTTITAGLGTSFEPTTIANVAGSIIYSGDLRAAHAFSDRLVGEAGVGYSFRSYQGTTTEQKTLTGFLGGTYALTRNLALKAQYRYTDFDSSEAGADYTENAIEAGLRFRH